MSKAKHFPGNLAILIATGLLPGIPFLSGLGQWIFGRALLSPVFVGTHFILPVLTHAALYCIFTQSKDTRDRAIFTSIVLAGFFIMTIVLRFQGTSPTYDTVTGEEALSRYTSSFDYQTGPMPRVEELGQPEQIEYHYFTNFSAASIGSDCTTLICTYTPADFAAMTENLSSEPVLCYLEGYTFCILQFDSHTVLMIGTNKETHEIAWSYCGGDALDYTSDPQEFLLDDCGWKYIR